MNKLILIFIAMATFSMAILGSDVVVPCTTASIFGMNIQCREIGCQPCTAHMIGVKKNDELDINETCDQMLKKSPIQFNAYYFLDKSDEVKFVECLVSNPAPISFAEANPPLGFFFGGNNAEINILQARRKEEHEMKLRKRSDEIKTYISKCNQ